MFAEALDSLLWIISEGVPLSFGLYPIIGWSSSSSVARQQRTLAARLNADILGFLREAVVSDFTDEERRADALRRAAENSRRDEDRKRGAAYHPVASDPFCMICSLQFPSYHNRTPETPICLSCL